MKKSELKQLIISKITKTLNESKKKDCNCGCNTCENVGNEGVLLNESVAPKQILSENLQYHVDNQLPLTENTFRYGSESFFNLWAEARSLYLREIIHVNEDDKEILTETDLGHYGMFEGKKVPLDFPMEITEAYYTAIANLGNGKTKENLDSFEEVQDFMDKMIKRHAIFVEVTKFSQEGKSQTLKYNWDGEKWVKVNTTSINEQMDIYDDIANSEFGMDYDQLDSNEQEWVRDEIDNMPMNEITDGNFVKGIELLRSTLSKEGGAAGLEPLVKALSGLGFSKDEVVDLIKNNINIKQHRDGDYILLPLEEAAKKNTKKLNKPMRDSSGGKAYKVYVKDPKTKKIKTVRFGSGGLRAKINDKKARNAFAARHKCAQKKDKTKAGYWSCRLPRYAKLLGLKSSFSGFW